jgi:hypothetical protein
MTLLGALIVVVVVARLVGGTHYERPGPASARDVQTARSLESRALASIKRTFVLLATDRQPAAAIHLHRAATREHVVALWLRARPDFVKVNKAAVGCVAETAERLTLDDARFAPALRTGALRPQASRQLRIDLGEAGNCLQTGE